MRKGFGFYTFVVAMCLAMVCATGALISLYSVPMAGLTHVDTEQIERKAEAHVDTEQIERKAEAQVDDHISRNFSDLDNRMESAAEHEYLTGYLDGQDGKDFMTEINRIRGIYKQKPMTREEFRKSLNQ